MEKTARQVLDERIARLFPAGVAVHACIDIAETATLMPEETPGTGDMVPARLREKAGAVEDWAILGDRVQVYDKLQEYVEVLGMTHLIARGQVSRLVADQQENSHDMLLDIAARL